jgi:nucleoid DNA-binding protein
LIFPIFDELTFSGDRVTQMLLQAVASFQQRVFEDIFYLNGQKFLIFVKDTEQEVDITAFIRELLFGHDCVIVPGFGGFIGNYMPAVIDKSSGTFYPPVKKISFNRNLNHNDGLLVGRISGEAKISYGDARSMVEEFVADTRKKLEKGEKVVFDKIGSFINNQEGNLQFEPDRNANYHLDSYGLESFQCLPLEGYDVRKRILRHNQADPARQASIRKILWRAAVIVPFLAVMVAVSLKTDLFKSKVESTNLNPLVSAEFENNKNEVDKDIKNEPVLTAKNISPETETLDTPPVTEPVAADESYFSVITGSFKSEANAISQADMLKEEGFTPEISTAPNGFYRVCAMICKDKNTALAKKDSIAKKFPGTWISRTK